MSKRSKQDSADFTQAGPSNTLTTTRSSLNTINDAGKEKGRRTFTVSRSFLEERAKNKIFGHYWTRFLEEVEKHTRTQSTYRPDSLDESPERFSVGSKSMTLSVTDQSENTVDGENLEEPSAPEGSHLPRESTNVSNAVEGIPNIIASTMQEHSAEVIKRKEEARAKTTKKSSRKIEGAGASIHCGQCKVFLGHSELALKKLLLECCEAGGRDHLSMYKCLCCSRLFANECDVQNHIVTHFKKNEICCKKCQAGSKYGKVLYAIEANESFDTSLKAEARYLTLPRYKIENLERIFGTAPKCGACGNTFHVDAKIICNIYKPIFDKQVGTGTNTLYCCVLCGMCRQQIKSIKNDIFSHFESQQVHCQKCYAKLSPEQKPEFIVQDDMEANETKSIFGALQTMKKCLCGHCGSYIADSLILSPLEVMRNKKTMEEGHIKIKTETLYRCIICYSTYPLTTIDDHIVEHLLSNHIWCSKCQEIFGCGYACVRRLENLKQTELPVHVYCGKCRKALKESNFAGAYNVFSLKTMAKGKSDQEIVIYFCEVCRKTFNLKSNMTSHISKHTANKELLCSSCKREAIERAI